MMTSSRQALVLFTSLAALLSSTDAFGVVSITSYSSIKSSTGLFAEEKAADSSSSDAAGDILSSPAFLKRKLEVIKTDIAKSAEDIKTAQAALDEGRKEWGGKFADLSIERTNLQERMSKQGGDADGKATVEIARKVLNVLDNFDRAFGVVEPESDEEKAIEAEFRGAYQGIIDTFVALGVREVECVGTEFDYEQHSAVMTRPSEDYEEGIVIEELQKGFILGEPKTDDDDDDKPAPQLIRAAMVIVAA